MPYNTTLVRLAPSLVSDDAATSFVEVNFSITEKYTLKAVDVPNDEYECKNRLAFQSLQLKRLADYVFEQSTGVNDISLLNRFAKAGGVRLSLALDQTFFNSKKPYGIDFQKHSNAVIEQVSKFVDQFERFSNDQEVSFKFQAIRITAFRYSRRPQSSIVVEFDSDTNNALLSPGEHVDAPELGGKGDELTDGTTIEFGEVAKGRLCDCNTAAAIAVERREAKRLFDLATVRLTAMVDQAIQDLANHPTIDRANWIFETFAGIEPSDDAKRLLRETVSGIVKNGSRVHFQEEAVLVPAYLSATKRNKRSATFFEVRRVKDRQRVTQVVAIPDGLSIRPS